MPKKANDKTNSNIETNLNKITKIEIDSINSSISFQTYMKDTVLSLSDSLWNKLSLSSNIDAMHSIGKILYDISDFSLRLQSNINSLETLKLKLEELYLATNTSEIDKTLTTKIKKYHDESLILINQCSEFNLSFKEFITKISEINFSSFCISDNIVNDTTDINDKTKTSKEKIKKTKKNKSDVVSCIPDGLKENTLVISNTEVILPFSEDDLDDKLIESDLTSYKDVVDTFYKRSAKSFEPSVISRFKEAYSLIINREHGSKLKALNLALELSTNYNLHPAIIAACKNLTQLDVYLSCLEYNELSDFHFFDIVYNIPPTPKKQKSKKTIKDT